MPPSSAGSAAPPRATGTADAPRKRFAFEAIQLSSRSGRFSLTVSSALEHTLNLVPEVQRRSVVPSGVSPNALEEDQP